MMGRVEGWKEEREEMKWKRNGYGRNKFNEKRNKNLLLIFAVWRTID
jgi:hypothetical protein